MLPFYTDTYLIIELGQKRPKPEAPSGRDRVHEAGTGSVKAADLKMISVSTFYRWWLMIWAL